MSANVWYTKCEGIALNELTTILIIFDPLMSINDNLECGYYIIIVIIVFIEHAYFMFQMWVLQNHSNKTNVYFVTFMQIFHIEFYVFEII